MKNSHGIIDDFHQECVAVAFHDNIGWNDYPVPTLRANHTFWGRSAEMFTLGDEKEKKKTLCFVLFLFFHRTLQNLSEVKYNIKLTKISAHFTHMYQNWKFEEFGIK